MPDVFAGVEPDAGEFSDFEALNSFVKSKDPRAKVALSKLTPREMTAYTQWAQQQPEASQTPKGLALASGAALAAGAAPFAPAIPGVGAAATGALQFGKTMLPYIAIGVGGKALGLNQGTIDAMMIALGLKGLGRGAGAAAGAAAGEVGAAEEAMAGRAAATGAKGAKEISSYKLPMSEAEYAASKGTPREFSMPDNPRNIPLGPAERPFPPNVVRGGSKTMMRAPQGPGIGNPVENQIPAPTATPPNVTRGGPATMGRAPRQPGMFGNPEGGSVTFNEPPTPPRGGGKSIGSGRTFGESASEKASREVLEDTARRTGSMKKTGNGTFKEPQKAPMPELPPGYKKGMKPEEFDRLFNDYANKNEDPALLERMRQRIEKGLPKPAGPRKTQPRKPK